MFVTLFVIMDPPGTIPIFLALTGGLEPRLRHRAAWQAVAVAFAVIVAFAVGGAQILRYLGLELLTGKQDDPTQQTTSNVGLVPLGTPLLAGPGAIVATILFVRRADGVADVVGIALAIVAIHLVIYAVMRFSSVIVKVLRPGGIEVVTRVAGLLLAAIAVQLVADSVASFVAHYSG